MVFPSAYLGGSELSVLETIRSLKGRMMFYAVVPCDGDLVEKLKSDCEEVFQLHYSWWVSQPAWNTILKIKMVKDLTGSAVQFYRLLKKLKPDLLLTSTLVIPSAAAASLLHGTKHIWYIHELGEEDQGLQFNYGTRFSYWFMNKTTDLFLINSKNVGRKFNAVFRDKIRLVPQAIEMLSPLSPDKLLPVEIVFIGRVCREKNQEELIRAIHALRKFNMNPGVRFVGRADENYKTYLQQLAKDLDVYDQIQFLDFLMNVTSVLSSAQMLVVCSKNEAFGRVVVEAMKCHVPVIVANTGSGPDLVDDGITGLLYRFNDPSDLALKIRTYIENEALRVKIAQHAFDWASHNFNTKRHADEMETVLMEVIG